MPMVGFLLRRGVHAVFVLFGLSIVIFVISRVVPGDPARMSVGYRAPEEVVQRLREAMRLNEPLPVQYAYWLGNALRGDLGMSLVTRRPVASDVAQFFPATLELALFAGLVMAVGGIGLGALSALYKDRWVDNAVRLIAYMGVVTPSFVFAIIFMLVFGYWLNWLPALGRLSTDVAPPPSATGLLTVDALLAGDLRAFGDALRHLAMPALALAMPGLAQAARITRASMTGNMGRDYVAFARALGVPERRITWGFLLKPSLIPTVSILGLDFAATIGNAFLVELIFNWPGISRYGINAMLNKDLNAISAVVLILGLVFVVVNIVVDIIIGILDPRIRLVAQRG